MDVLEHNALAALPPFIISVLSLTGLYSDGPPPPQGKTCHFSGLSVSLQEPKIRMLLTNKDIKCNEPTILLLFTE